MGQKANRRTGPRPAPDGPKRASVGLRITPAMKATAERLARAERRSLNSWIEGLMLRAFAEAGETESRR